MTEPVSPRIDLRQNWLQVDGHTLHADFLPHSAFDAEHIVDPARLDEILELGRIAILSGIEDFYELTKARNPGATVVRPSIFVAHLGTDRQEPKVLTQKGQDNNTSVHKGLSEVQPAFHEFWSTVGKNGFNPEIRSRMVGEGSLLLLRKPEIQEIIHEILGFKETRNMTKLREGVRNIPDNIDAVRQSLMGYRIIGEVEVSKLRGSKYMLAQIGLILSCGEFKRQVGDIDGFEQELEDAILYANYTPGPIDANWLRRMIENATWQKPTED